MPTVDASITARDRTKAAYQSARRNVDGLAVSAKSLSNRFVALTGGFIAAGVAIRGAARAGRFFVDTLRELESIRNVLNFATSSVEEGGRQFQFATETADRFGLALDVLGVNYGKLLAATQPLGFELEESQTLFTGLAKAARALNLDTEKTRLIFFAVSQIASKGTVSMEELRRQLGEHLPGALQLAAEAMGTTTQGLIRLVESGELASDVFLRQFGPALNRKYGDAAEAQSKSLAAEMDRLGTRIKIAISAFNDLTNAGAGVAATFRGASSVLQNVTLSMQALNRAVEGSDWIPDLENAGAYIAFLASQLPGVTALADGFGALAKAQREYNESVKDAENAAKELMTLEEAQQAYLELQAELKAATDAWFDTWLTNLSQSVSIQDALNLRLEATRDRLREIARERQEEQYAQGANTNFFQLRGAFGGVPTDVQARIEKIKELEDEQRRLEAYLKGPYLRTEKDLARVIIAENEKRIMSLKGIKGAADDALFSAKEYIETFRQGLDLDRRRLRTLEEELERIKDITGQEAYRNRLLASRENLLKRLVEGVSEADERRLINRFNLGITAPGDIPVEESDGQDVFRGFFARASDGFKEDAVEFFDDVRSNLRQAMLSGDLSNVGAAAFQAFQAAILDRFLERSFGSILSGLGLAPARQFGGPVQGGRAYTVGEQGPELFIPNADGRVLSNAQTKQASMRGGGGTTVNIQDTFVGIPDESVITSVRRERRALVRMVQGGLYERRALGRG